MTVSALRATAAPKKALTTTAVAAATAAALALTSAPAHAAPRHSAAYAKAAARQMIPDAAQFHAFSKIVQRESGWNPRATNASSGAYGLVQALPASKMSSAGADWRTNPKTQIKWGLKYMKSRYGSPAGAWRFWQAHGWY
ncbi:transglycosylase SLT domain-containing protein [Streptomyces sp. NPDC017179]|uniref:aggregation-promoting factor C-terminal-like domain-containing protein n=1 Tax=Streptomyces sp. NPDC017179 TaxID=3364979 RepID=UPI0037A193AC